MPVPQAAHNVFEYLSRGEPWRQYLSLPKVEIKVEPRSNRQPVPSPLSAEQRVRNFLLHSDGDTAIRIAIGIDVSSKWTGKVLDGLYKRGYVDKVGAKKNRRWVITELGRATRLW